MRARGPFIVGEQPGFAPEVARLVVMLSYARRTTVKAVEGLTAPQLDHRAGSAEHVTRSAP